ncbi:MAG: phosphoribosylglycinamide formyltransferase [Anaerolineae bacterium]|nr:phosphoribosylglycinamide formyltransferase [Anaerolineae bacterium]
MKRIVVLVSGSGTNLQALIDARAALGVEIALVVSNRKDAYALERAKLAQIPTLYCPLKAYTDRAQYDADLADQIAPCAPDLIVLAGWMHILSPAFLNRFPHKVINLHPALPGAFPGVDAIQRAYAAYQRGAINQTGIMVHYVIPEVDAGAVIAQAPVIFRPGEPLDEFERRMHLSEHDLIVRATGIALGVISQ